MSVAISLSTYFDQFDWTMSGGAVFCFSLPFFIVFVFLNPVFLSLGFFEVIFTWFVMSLAKFFCEHEWTKKAGSAHFLTFVSVLLLSVNLVGMLPFVKGVSVMPVFTLIYGLMFWSMGSLATVWGLGKFSKGVWVKGAPLPLNLFVVCAELLSWLIRPFVLGIRLLVNVSCGHIILALLGELVSFFAWEGSVMGAILTLSIGLCIGVLEWVVMLVQVFVFVSIIAWSWGEGSKGPYSLFCRFSWSAKDITGMGGVMKGSSSK
uniref:ATP synthase subunit a n=1 Tax=Pecten albicans TaxID=106278 RepID=A0A0F6QSY3_9BIVA|nr:ATP synthase F0 subunit 6 [Pecten albicans]